MFIPYPHRGQERVGEPRDYELAVGARRPTDRHWGALGADSSDRSGFGEVPDVVGELAVERVRYAAETN